MVVGHCCESGDLLTPVDGMPDVRMITSFYRAFKIYFSIYLTLFFYFLFTSMKAISERR